MPQGHERWIVVVTDAGLARTRATMMKRAQQDQEDQEDWERQLWHLGNQEFACQADAEAAMHRRLKHLPIWLRVASMVTSRPHYAGRGRPPQDAPPTREAWQVQARVTLDEEQLEREAHRRARFIVATTVLDPTNRSDEQAIGVYKAQSGVERGLAFLKGPLYLASSGFLKEPERIMALALIMVQCLLVYRLAEWRLRAQLAATDHRVPNQLEQPTTRPPPCAGCSSASKASAC